jgi:hypothetical protein
MPIRHGGSFWKNVVTWATLQLPTDNHLAGSINAMNLKD